jgi:hypothetical protein
MLITVTRLSEIRPVGNCLLWEASLKLHKKTKCWGNFSPRKKLCINFDNNGLGYILGGFFTDSSGHPEGDAPFARPNFLRISVVTGSLVIICLPVLKRDQRGVGKRPKMFQNFPNIEPNLGKYYIRINIFFQEKRLCYAENWWKKPKLVIIALTPER